MRSFVKAFAAPPQALVTIVLLVTLTQTGLTLQASEAFMRFLPVRAVHSCWDRGTCTRRCGVVRHESECVDGIGTDDHIAMAAMFESLRMDTRLGRESMSLFYDRSGIAEVAKAGRKQGDSLMPGQLAMGIHPAFTAAHTNFGPRVALYAFPDDTFVSCDLRNSTSEEPFGLALTSVFGALRPDE